MDTQRWRLLARKRAMTPDIAFLHTAPVHVETFAALTERLRPGTRATHFVDESLLRDAREFGHDAPEVVERVQGAVRAAATGARVVVCTCSTIGAAAEATPTDGTFVAQRIDRAMADAAVRSGSKVLVVAALSSTLAPTATLVADSAKRLGLPVATTEHLVDGAWTHFECGDLTAYYGAIAAAVRERAVGFDAVVLAQASMAPAAALLTDVAAPVLSSPEPGVRAALR